MVFDWNEAKSAEGATLSSHGRKAVVNVSKRLEARRAGIETI
jgi:hypothetical protein